VTHAPPTAMNRQVGPSIVLSILIVGFFAVALFQRDPPRSAHRRPSSPLDQPFTRMGTERSDPPERPPARPAPFSAPAVPSAARPASRSMAANPVVVEPVQRRDSPGTASPIKVLTAARERESQAIGLSHAAGPPQSPSLPGTTISTRTGEPPTAASSVSALRAGSARTTAIHHPRSAFTVVEANETVRDVALRVYGREHEVDLLWQANRDTLPRKDSPLPAGTLLRTPGVR
jgi:hypothetical protein